MLAITYCRVSSDHQKANGNIESQRPIVASIAKNNNCNVIEAIEDDGITGTLLSGRNLQSLLDRLDNGQIKIDAIIVASVDRLFREDWTYEPTGNPERDKVRASIVRQSLIDVAIIKGKLITHGIIVIDAKGMHKANDIGFAIEQSLTAVDLGNVKGRMARGKSHRLLVDKKYVLPKPPYGYRCEYDNRGKRIGVVVDERDRDRLIAILGWYVAGGVAGAAKQARSAGFETPMADRNRIHGRNWDKCKWSIPTIRLLVKNAYCYYTGVWSHSFLGQATDLRFAPLIDRELYMAVIGAAPNRRGRPDKKIYVTTGVLVCECGKSVHINGTEPYLQCSHGCMRRIRYDCAAPFIWQMALDRMIEIRDSVKAEYDGNGWAEKIDVVKYDISKIKERMARLLLAYEDGAIGLGEFRERNVPNQIALKDKERELTTLEQGRDEHRANRIRWDIVGRDIETLISDAKSSMTNIQKNDILKRLLRGKQIRVCWGERNGQAWFVYPTYRTLGEKKEYCEVKRK